MSEFFGQEIQTLVLSVPVGTMVEYAGDTAPNDWMKCEGQALSKTTYSALFAVIGERFGSGDGSGAQFNLPDCRDRVVVGKSDTRPVGTAGGVETHKHDPGSFGAPDHLHSIAHQHYIDHTHGIWGRVGIAEGNQWSGCAAGGTGPFTWYNHQHSLVEGATHGSSKPWTDPIGDKSGPSDRALSLVGQSADASTMQPFVVCTKLIKVV